MKIAFYIPTIDRGGPDRVFFELIRYFHSCEHVALLVDRAGGDYYEKLKSAGVRIQSFATKKRYPFKRFSSYVRENKPDVVVCTLDAYITASISRFLYRLPVSIIARPANHVTMNARELMRKNPLKYGAALLLTIAAARLSDIVVCQSKDLFDDLRRYGVPSKKMVIIGNPAPRVSEEDLVSMSTPKDFDGKHLVTAFGRICYQKGFDVLIEAVSLLPSKHKALLRLDVYGLGPDFEKLESLIKVKSLVGIVTLKGYASTPSRHMAESYFVVSSSRFEGFPNSILESLAQGTPVVATNCPGGTKDLVVNGETGWLCESENPRSLADAISSAINSNPFSRQDVARAIQKRFGAEEIFKAYAEIIRLPFEQRV